MLYTDTSLACLALFVAAYTKSREPTLLFLMCGGCAVLTHLGTHIFLGALWYTALCIYLFIFFHLSSSLLIKALNICMQGVFLYYLLRYPTDISVMCGSFTTVIGCLFLAQLGASTYGDHDDIQRGYSSGKYGDFTTHHTGAVV